MKNIIKKNQVVIGTIALMLIAAGYMNYTVNTKDTLKDATLTDGEKYGDLGDAKLVSSNMAATDSDNNVQSNNTNSNTQNNENKTNQENNVSAQNETDPSAVATSNDTENTDTNKYFTQSKMDRENMYSEMLESYQKMLDNQQMSSAQKGIAQNEIKTINDRRNAIMIAENLIKNKGFDDVIIFMNDDNTDVVVKSKQLKTEQIAQIQNIVQRELKSDVENIHISSKS